MIEATKYLMLTKQEAELIMDSFKVTNPMSRELALKIAGLVLEWAAKEDLSVVEHLLQDLSTGHLSTD